MSPRRPGPDIGPAITALETARRLGSLPATDEAVRQGRLSEAQVKEIAGAAILQPEAEQSLVDAAGQQPLNVLKLRCRRVRAAGEDPATAYVAVHRARYLRNWVEDSGAVRFDARLTPDEGARLLASVEAETARLAAAARRAGVDEPRRALAADALVGLACGRTPLGDGPGRRRRGTRPPAGGTAGAAHRRGRRGPCRTTDPTSVIHVRVDHAALVRGRVEGGELCEIPGVGPSRSRWRGAWPSTRSSTSW